MKLRIISAFVTGITIEALADAVLTTLGQMSPDFGLHYAIKCGLLVVTGLVFYIINQKKPGVFGDLAISFNGMAVQAFVIGLIGYKLPFVYSPMFLLIEGLIVLFAFAIPLNKRYLDSSEK